MIFGKRAEQFRRLANVYFLVISLLQVGPVCLFHPEVIQAAILYCITYAGLYGFVPHKQVLYDPAADRRVVAVPRQRGR